MRSCFPLVLVTACAGLHTAPEVDRISGATGSPAVPRELDARTGAGAMDRRGIVRFPRERALLHSTGAMETDIPDHWLALARPVVQEVWAREEARLVAWGIGLDALVETCARRTRERLGRLGREDDQPAFREALERAALADVALALALEQGSDAAWSHYQDHLRGRVVRAARGRGASLQVAEELADELPGTLLAAAGDGHPSPLARYDGSGSLAGWMATIAGRRVVDRSNREARRESLAEHHLPHDARLPESELLDAEQLEGVRRAARSLREELTARERLALLLRHQQGLAGRSVARMLGVSDSRVTRLLQAASNKVRARLESFVRPPVPEELPVVLLDVLGSGEEQES